MIRSKKAELDAAMEEVLVKIEGQMVTCEDFNRLITKTIIGESTPEAIRDRLRRRTTVNATDSHIDTETGHQQLQAPTLAARVQPKRQPGNQQNHGRAGIAHDHAARTQARDARLGRLQPAVEFVEKHLGQPLTEAMMADVPNKLYVKMVATRMMNQPGADRDWLYDLVAKIEQDLKAELNNGN